MNHIFWDVDKITIMTDVMDATIHRHAMMQFFVCTEGKLDIKVGKEQPDAKCVLVNKNVKHSFNADKRLCLTTIIEPVSALGLALDVVLDSKDYYVVDESMADALIRQVICLKEHPCKDRYSDLMDVISECFGLLPSPKLLDERIIAFLKMLEHCDCDDHSIEEYAGELNLSASRLSHLFSEQIGIPIKKYLILHQLEKAFAEILEKNGITTTVRRTLGPDIEASCGQLRRNHAKEASEI